MSIECSNCCFVFQNEKPNKPREKWEPCPKCGSLRRNIRFTHRETLELHEYKKLKAKRPASTHKNHRADYEFEEGKKIGRNGKLVYKKSIKDREHANSRHSYIEIFIDSEGNALANKDEKLSNHR